MNQLPHWILTDGPPSVSRPTRLTFAVDPTAGKLYYWDTQVWVDITGGIASLVAYNPLVPTDWSPPAPALPINVQEALDQLAARIKALETSGVPAVLAEDFLSGDPLIALGDAVYHDTVANTVKRANAASLVTAPTRGFAIALLPGNVVRVKWQGSVTIPGGGLVPGTTYYLAIGTPGGITAVDTSLGPPGSICQEVGYAQSATKLVALVDGDFVKN